MCSAPEPSTSQTPGGRSAQNAKRSYPPLFKTQEEKGVRIMANRKSLQELQTSTRTAMHALKELGQQEDMSTMEYVKSCIDLVLPFGRFITTEIVGTQDKAIQIATKQTSSTESITAWLTIAVRNERSIPLFFVTTLKVVGSTGGQTKPVEMTLEKVVSLFNEDLEVCGAVIDSFIHNTVLPEIKKRKDKLPTSDQLKQDRLKFLKDLCATWQSQLAEIQATVASMETAQQ